MTAKDFQKKSLLSIFLSYFKPHLGLFFLDMACALMISLIDLAFPYVSRMCMYDLIPESLSSSTSQSWLTTVRRTSSSPA